jgi:hypothetical protein
MHNIYYTTILDVIIQCELKLEIENEIHFLLQCPILNSFRTEAMQQISDICKNFASLDNKSKFIWLLSNGKYL